MREILVDIQAKLKQGVYKNEEHVRLNLVLRILEKLGWDIWNPSEVFAEFQSVRTEDTTRVDFALFLKSREPSIYIEVKTVGGIDQKLPEIERQLRDYNRNNTASFCIITDGCKWRFYLSQTGGEFKDKCFKVIDFFKDDIDDIELALNAFLGISEIDNENAKKEAEKYLKLNQKQRVMQDFLPEARRLINIPPYPRLPEALVGLVKQNGFEITVDDATEFIRDSENTLSIPTVFPPTSASYSDYRDLTNRIDRNHNSNENISFTKILEGNFGGQRISSWNQMIETGIKTALNKGWTINDLKSILPVKEGYHTSDGYKPISDIKISYQNMDANKCWSKSQELAKKLGIHIRIRLRWRDKEGAAHPGQERELTFP